MGLPRWRSSTPRRCGWWPGGCRSGGSGGRRALGSAAATGRQLDQIAGGDAAHLAAGVLRRIARPSGPRRYGMCGLLTGYDPATAVISP